MTPNQKDNTVSPDKNNRFRKLAMNVLLLFVFAVLTSCDGTKSDSSVISPTQRSGKAIGRFESKYIDDQPSLSSDASKLIFLSSRDESIPRVFSSTRLASASYSAPERLSTSTGLSAEHRAVLSPNGERVLIQGTTSSGQTLILCNWAGSTCESVTTTPWGRGEFDFSPDSLSFYFLEGASTSPATLKVASVSSVSTQYTIGESSHWQKARWLPSSSGYRLISTTRASTPSLVDVYLATFSQTSAAASTTPALITSGMSSSAILAPSPLGGSTGTSNASYFLWAQPQAPSVDATFEELGDLTFTVESPSRKIPLKNNLRASTVDGSSATVIATGLGFEWITGVLASDGNTIFSLSRIAGRCTTDGNKELLSYGPSISITDRSTGAITWKYLKRTSDLTTDAVAAASFCERTDGYTPEFGISTIRVNAAATNSAYTVAWVSESQGDPEVSIMEVSGASTTITNISNNRAL
jgi:hypothetical protein